MSKTEIKEYQKEINCENKEIRDHLTRKVYHITSRAQTEKDFINLIEVVLKEGKPKLILCDQYSALKSNKLKNYLKELAIRLEYICTDSPQSNGMIERVEQTIVNGVRCSLYDRELNCASEV